MPNHLRWFFRIANLNFLWFCSLLLLTPVSGVSADLSAHMLIGTGTSIKDSKTAIDLAHAIGLNSIRLDAPWAETEKQQGVYKVPEWVEESVQLALNHNMRPMLILDYGNELYGGDKPKSAEAIEAFCKYAQFMTGYFKGRVELYQVWNEWHARTGKTTPGSAEEYIALLKQVYPVIKAVDPKIVVIASSFSTEAMNSGGWMQDFIQQGGYKFADAVSIHPYVYMFNGNEQKPAHAIELVDQLEADLKSAKGADFPIYVTEFGYPTNTGRFGIEEEVRAGYLKDFFSQVKSRPYIHGVWWYGLFDQGDDPANKEHRFGLYGRDWTIKPTGVSLTEWIKNNQ